MKNTIYHCAREIAPGGGVSGVAHFLMEEMKTLGVDTRAFTIDDIGLHRGQHKSNSLGRKKLLHLFDVILFSTLGSLLGRWRTRGAVVISHNDGVFGQIYVNHGLHRAMLDASGQKARMLMRNPIHLFLLAREWVRFATGVHQYVVCFSRPEAEQFQRYFPSTRGRIEVIPNGVNLKRFSPDTAARLTMRLKLGAQSTDHVLAFVGHEFERKGLHLIVQALASLPDHVKLWVAGGTAQEIAKGQELAQKVGVPERVKFLGVVKEVPALMNGADTLVLPSTFEAWPLVGLEAMACGTPVLMTAVGGIPDFLKPRHNGLFVQRTHQSIAEQVQVLLDEPGLHTALRQGALATAAHYAWSEIASRYIRLAQRCST
jgi:glycosyltransferase involved in cell wall biosynthesis